MIGLSLRQRGLFSPRQLFARGEAGAWYDPSDIRSIFQDSAGTVPAAVDGPVGRLADKSGRGNHAVQAVAAARPTLRSESGRLYLEFDGVDDCLRAAFAIAQPWDRISALRQISWTSNDRVFGGSSVNSGELRQAGSSPLLHLFSGLGFEVPAPAVGANAVIAERHAGANSRGAVNAGAYSIGNGGTSAADGISIAEVGSSVGVVRAANIRLYGLCMVGRALSDGETLRLRRFMASKAGVAFNI